MSRQIFRVALGMLLASVWCAPAAADYKLDIGYTQLQVELGEQTPTGAGVKVTQVEAGTTDSNYVNYYLPNTSDAEFTGKFFTPLTIPAGVSSHATTVGGLFYGSSSSIAPEISNIDVDMASKWISRNYLNILTKPPLVSSSRVANHSWVDQLSSATANVQILKRLDWVVHRDEYIQVVAMNNGTTNKALLGTSFNAVAVGLSNGGAASGSAALDSLYTAGRTRPDLVAPASAASYATPMVSAAAALLVEVGHNGGGALSTDPQVISTTNRSGSTIYNAERSEVVKAALMTGASRTSLNLTNTKNPGGYTVNTANGLNSSYGAGELNIYNSYRIIAAGEQNSSQDNPVGAGADFGSAYFCVEPLVLFLEKS